MKKLIIFGALLLTLTVSVSAQVAQGGRYKIDQSLMAVLLTESINE